jgi:hypothetical protein
VRHMLNTVIKDTIWPKLSDAAERVQQGTDEGAGRKLLELRMARALRAAALDGPVPYSKVPQTAVGVTALFHEMLASPESGFPTLYTLRTGVFGDQDELIYLQRPNGDEPIHVLFGRHVKDITDQLQVDERLMETVRLAVVWEVGKNPPVSVEAANDPTTGATHEILLYKAIERLPVVALRSVLEQRARSRAAP